MAGGAFLGDQRLAVSFREILRILGSLEHVCLGDALRPCRRQRRTAPVGERQADLCIVAGGDRHIGEPVALSFGADALDAIKAGGQILGLELTTIFADNQEGQTALVILEFYVGTGDRLSGPVVHDALDRAPVVLRLCGSSRNEDGSGRNSDCELPAKCSNSHGLFYHWLLSLCSPSPTVPSPSGEGN